MFSNEKHEERVVCLSHYPLMLRLLHDIGMPHRQIILSPEDITTLKTDYVYL